MGRKFLNTWTFLRFCPQKWFAGRRRLVAQPGGLTLGLGLVSNWNQVARPTSCLYRRHNAVLLLLLLLPGNCFCSPSQSKLGLLCLVLVGFGLSHSSDGWVSDAVTNCRKWLRRLLQRRGPRWHHTGVSLSLSRFLCVRLSASQGCRGYMGEEMGMGTGMNPHRPDN